jgi:OOP family OmpA-OmpF porin
VQNLNAVLDRGLSLHNLKWRIEAWKTGRNYAEIVLYHTLIYRVEEVLLIQRPSGILLHHLAAPGVPPIEPDVASAMLSAIQDFVADSLGSRQKGELQTLEAGSLTVWIEPGPSACLAAVIQGRPPGDLRESLQRALECIHREFGQRLASSDGLDGAPGEVEAILSECLTSAFRPSSAGKPYGKVALGLGVVALMVWATLWGVSLFRENKRWSAYLERLSSEEGIVVTRSRSHLGRFHVAGWRDPLAADPAGLLGPFNLPADRVTDYWEQYHAISPGMVLRRATRVLRPPEQITLQFTNGILSAAGDAPRDWLKEIRLRAEMLPGVVEFDARQVNEAGSDPAAAWRRIDAAVLHFQETTRLVPGQEQVLDALVRDLAEIAAAEPAGSRLQLLITGHTDRTGTSESNLRLSLERASEVRRLLAVRGVSNISMVISGIGSSLPMRPGMAASEEHRNRRATFRAVIERAGTRSVP